ncbi:trypsin-like peptidase [Stackebrandtia endophytica]|uniref:Trypsin-like peptidase n=1 Tax=Stackebrandtia endophytica TaxID=1496996 RepID=A0A543AQ30_9ACTN|nr:tetratricopeptide repeat protein [Stackebrandtia endophytica]TQL74703.1 trypsin-like peptidase [Stackebrandtia endophytica]
MAPIAIRDEALHGFGVKISVTEPTTRGFRGSGFFIAPGFVLTCSHVVHQLPIGAPLWVSTGSPPHRPRRDIRGRLRARTPMTAGTDGIWGWPDLAIIELSDATGDRHTDHPSPRVDPNHPTPQTPTDYRAIVAVRPNTGNEHSIPELRSVDFTWESVSESGFWWLKEGHALKGMSGGMVVDRRSRAIVAALTESRGFQGAVAVPLAALSSDRLPGEFAAVAAEVLAQLGPVDRAWDAAFTDQADGRAPWRSYWPSIPGFVGRQSELDQLKSELERHNGFAVIQSIHGFGGVGKTALATAFGDRFQHEFAGRIFHDFRSYRSSQSDSAFDALGSVLRTAGLATTEDVAKSDYQERVRLWRENTNGRRLLMLWDNVDSPEQLEGLLVNGEGCATLITSRDMIKIEGGVHRLRLDVLTPEDAAAMFHEITAHEYSRELVAELVHRDLYVPVLINTHAQEVRSGEITLAEIIADLPDPQEARHHSHPEHQKDLFDRLTGSYRRLSGDAQLAFRAMGAHPGYNATVASLAAAMGCDTVEAARRMRQVQQSGLAERYTPEGVGQPDDATLRGFRAHDLIRAFGAHLAETTTVPGPDGQSTSERDRFRSGMMEHFIKLLTGNDFKDWFEVEADTIRDLALTGSSKKHGVLARNIGYRALVYNRYDAAEVGFQHGTRIGEKLGDVARTAHCHWGLGEVARLTGNLDSAEQRYREALRLSTSAEDPGGIGNAHRGLAEVEQLRDEPDAAAARWSQAMEAYRAIDDRRRVAYVERGLARVAELQGRFELAERYFTDSLDSSRTVGDRIGIAYALRGLGDIHLRQSSLDQARDRYSQSQAAYREIGDPVGAATGRRGLGRVAHARGDLDEARRLLTEAAEVFNAYHADTWVERVNADLADLD